MSTDLAGSVTATYTAAVPRPDDGENLTAAALSNMVLPILNRVEFLRDRTLLRPINTAQVVEDWANVTNSAPIIGDSGPWTINEGGATHGYTQVQSVGGFGAFQVQNSSGNAGVISISKGLARIDTVERMSFRGLISSVGTGLGLELGLCASGATWRGTALAVSVLYDPAASVNWQFRTHDGATETLTDTGVAVTGSQNYVFEIYPNGGNWELIVDGGSPIIRDTNLPAGSSSASFAHVFQSPNSGGGRIIQLDWSYLRAAVARIT